MCSDKVHVTAIELNPNSFQIAQRLVAKLGLEDRISLIQADATTYKPDTPIDLLISETMHSGLTQEKIVPITQNLVPKVREDGIVLPEAVKVKVGVASLLEYAKTERMVVFYSTPHMHIVPKWKGELTFKPGEDLQEIQFEINTEGLKPGLYLVSVSSEVKLPTGNLGDFDSLITTPQIALEANSSSTDASPWVLDLKEEDIGSKKIVIAYKPGDDSRGIAKLI
ncbi:MAG: hypothetical protein O3C63_07540, partial [Cyanobacteria bacterium]|nr:hypothetical protein [Cyanobacteriota bacterium]